MQANELYKYILGEKNSDYYLERFAKFDNSLLQLNCSWNWSAFFFGGIWALYRKMYDWFLLICGITAACYAIEKIINPKIVTILALGLWVAFATFSNAIYHSALKRKISAAQLSISDPDELNEHLKRKGGVHSWSAWIFAPLPLIGVALGFSGLSDKKIQPPHPAPLQSPSDKSPQDRSTPGFNSEGWTEESTESTEIGPWLASSPPGTRYCRYGNKIIYRIYPPGIKPEADKANPFCLLFSTETPN